MILAINLLLDFCDLTLNHHLFNIDLTSRVNAPQVSYVNEIGNGSGY
jgi:hypothetical protein